MICLVDTADGQRVRYTSEQLDATLTAGTTPLVKPGGENGSDGPWLKEEAGPGGDLSELKTRIFVPMQVGQKMIGELFVGSNAIDAFSNDDLSIINGVANQAALAIENAHLLIQHQKALKDAERRESELRVRERYLNLLSEITRATLKSQDFQVMLQTLVEYLAKLMDADSALILLWDGTRGQAIPASAYGSIRQVYRSFQFEPGELAAITSVLNSAGF